MASYNLNEISGFRDALIMRRVGGPQQPRYMVPDAQVVPNPDDLHITVSLTTRDIAQAAEGNLLFTDQFVQRGKKPGKELEAADELSLAQGFPDPKLYNFEVSQAEEIADRLLAAERLYLGPLVWNLRPGTFDAHYDPDAKVFRLYHGKIWLPDGHHRHQGIVHAFQEHRAAPDVSPDFDADHCYSVDIHFMTREEEGEFFYQKNFLGKPVAHSKAFDLTTRDPLAALARRMVELSDNLRGNVNRVTDTIGASSHHVVTLSTLYRVLETALQNRGGAVAMPERELEAAAVALARFYDLIAEVRPELRGLQSGDRRDRESLAAQAVTMHGYARLMARYLDDLLKSESTGLDDVWRKRLAKLAPDVVYKHDGYSGDFLGRDNPLWRDLGVIQKTKAGRDAVSNVRQTRETIGEELAKRVGL